MMQKKVITSSLQKRSLWIFFVLGAYYIATRLWLVYRYGDAAFGYDVGIYRRIVLDYISGTPQPPFAFGVLARTVYRVGFSVDFLLYGLYIAVAACIVWLFYIYVRERVGNTVALVAVCLFATSITQFYFFQWYYFRNIIAIALLLLLFVLVQKKSIFISAVLIILASLHPLTAIPIFLTLGIYAICQKEYRSYLLLHLSVSTGIVLLINRSEFARYVDIALLHKGRVAHTPPDVGRELDGQFVSLLEYCLYSILYLPFGLIGLWKYKKKYVLWSILFLVSALLICAKVLLYKRFFILIDLCLIFFASVYIRELYKKIQEEWWRYAVIVVACLYVFLTSFFYIAKSSAYISPQSLETIRSFSNTIPENSFLLSFSAETAPWLLGFAGNHTIIAPGVFDENKWNLSQWNIFWSTKDTVARKALLAEYGQQTIYLYSDVVGTDGLFANDPHITQLSPVLWVYSF